MSRVAWQVALFVLLLALDQYTKWWIEQQLPFFHYTVIDGWFDIVHMHNVGVAFSMLADWAGHGSRTLLGLTIAIAVALLIWWLRERHRQGWTAWMLVLILAGAVGNIIDRARLGYVVDFIDWHVRFGGETYHWPAFNIADTCITLGVLGLVFQGWRQR